MIKRFVDLTDLTPNRDLQVKIARGKRYGSLVELHFIDIDQFKRGCTKQFKTEIEEEFKGITRGFFYTDELRKDNMILDVALIEMLNKLKKQKCFNRYGDLIVRVDI